MSNLPNSDKDRIKVYPNEYITNSTINRPNLRLLQNDLYLEQLWTDAISGLLHIAGVINHNDLTGVTADQHHPQIHTINSHDTTATGANLTQLTNGSNADTLHTHSAAANHGHTHMDGTDQIPTVTSTAYGIMSPALFNQLEDAVLKGTDQTINSDKIINGDITVNGTFRATSAVFVETEHIGLSANYLELNSNETGSPTQDAGISVNRGTSTNAVVNWNETLDRWEVGISGSQDVITTNTELQVVSSQVDNNTTNISNIANNQSKYIPLSGSSEIYGSLIPNVTNVDLGSSSTPFRALYVSGSTIHIGSSEISQGDPENWDSKEPGFSKNSAFNKNFGTIAGTVCQGNDNRFNNIMYKGTYDTNGDGTVDNSEKLAGYTPSGLPISTATQNALDGKQTVLDNVGAIELAANKTGDRYSYIDFHSDDTNTDYSARIIRNPGTAGNLQIQNSGGYILLHQSAANMVRLLTQPDGTVDTAVATTKYVDDHVSGTIAAHDLGGAEHIADTLANLNSKISDATLVDLTKTGVIEFNSAGSGDRNTYIDFHSDDANTDYSFRIHREPGQNGKAVLWQKGTGIFQLVAGTNQVVLATQPTGTNDYSVATTKYVNDKVVPSKKGQIDYFIPGNYNPSVQNSILTVIGHNYSVWRQSNAHITAMHITHYGVDSSAQPSVALNVNGTQQTAIQLSTAGTWVSQTLNVAITSGQTLNIDLTSLNSGAGDATDLTISLEYIID